MSNLPKSTRLIRPHLWTAIGTIAATGLISTAPALVGGPVASATATFVVVQGGEGGEGGEKSVEADYSGPEFLAALGSVEGHLRAGLKLYESGDVTAAKRFIGHPALKKFKSVEKTVKARGFADMKAKVLALTEATEHGKPLGEIQSLFNAIAAQVDAIQAASPGGAADGLKALALLTREAAEDYAEGVKGGKISNLHEYQDAWGYMQTVKANAQKFSQSSKVEVAAVGQKILAQAHGTDKAFGDIHGKGSMTMDPSLIFAAAAHMELAALAIR